MKAHKNEGTARGYPIYGLYPHTLSVCLCFRMKTPRRWLFNWYNQCTKQQNQTRPSSLEFN